MMRVVDREQRFPQDFIFQPSAAEKSEVITNCDHLTRLKFAKSPPFAFTGHGAIMAATVLNSPQAISMSVHVVRVFIRIREKLVVNAAILKRLAEIDKSLLQQDSALRDICHKLLPLRQPPADRRGGASGSSRTTNDRAQGLSGACARFAARVLPAMLVGRPSRSGVPGRAASQ